MLGWHFDLVRTGCEETAKIGDAASLVGDTVQVSAVSSPARPLVLVVEDEPEIAALMRDFLEAAGFRVQLAADAEEASGTLAMTPDCVLLDVMLPGASGFELCRGIRAESDVPILFLSARGGDADKIRGLGLGGDDYIVKSATPAEVVARVRAVPRRSGTSREPARLRFGRLEVDLAAHEVLVDGRPVRLTAREFELLQVLVLHPRQVFSREHLFELVWGSHGDRSAVSVYVSRLREKIARRGCSVTIDRDGFERALANVIDNALGYTPLGGTVEVSCGAAGDSAFVRVVDDGPGIPSGLLPSVFEPMVRADSARNSGTGGAGLELTIAARLLRSQGGTIDAANAPARGAILTLRLPRKIALTRPGER